MVRESSRSCEFARWIRTEVGRIRAGIGFQRGNVPALSSISSPLRRAHVFPSTELRICTARRPREQRKSPLFDRSLKPGPCPLPPRSPFDPSPYSTRANFQAEIFGATFPSKSKRSPPLPRSDHRLHGARLWMDRYSSRILTRHRRELARGNHRPRLINA